jgi:hypothetical protein
MKLVLLMYLKEDARCVERLLGEIGVETYSRLAVEGHGPGSPVGWTREIPPYDSEMVFTIVPDDLAAALMKGVSECTGVEDPRHPIRAAMLDVEALTCCDLSQSNETEKEGA